MSYTQSDLITRMLRDLGLIDASEVPSAEDYEFVAQTIEADVATLSALGLPIWNGSEISIPLEYLIPISKRLGLSVAPAFGLMDALSAEAAKVTMEQSLTIMSNPRGAIPYPLRTDDSQRSRGSFNFATGL